MAVVLDVCVDGPIITGGREGVAVSGQASASGTVDGAIRFHWDVECDVLYLRLLSRAEAECYGDETDDRFVLLRALDDDAVVGMTIVSYWRRFGVGEPPEASDEDLARAARTFLARLLPVAQGRPASRPRNTLPTERPRDRAVITRPTKLARAVVPGQDARCLWPRSAAGRLPGTDANRSKAFALLPTLSAG